MWGPSSALHAKDYSSEEEDGEVNNAADGNDNDLFYDAHENGDDYQDDGHDDDDDDDDMIDDDMIDEDARLEREVNAKAACFDSDSASNSSPLIN